ncbi:MAG TPA: hypothetical protein VHX60_17685 [Acidobacteriaceae bacterium]|jgi:hypothetical protein|nr:hypothetical protein [Acidobacteriaceae bacterium]
MRKILFGLCILLVASASWAQGAAASWGNLNTLQAGEQIQVRTLESKKITGAFISVSDAAISVQADSGPDTVQMPDVRSVRLQRNRHRLRNAAILGGVGAGVGAGIGAVGHKGCSSSQTFCLDIVDKSDFVAIGAVAGLLGGAVVGALLPSHQTVYSLNAH